jgi:glutaminyl-peptide cyclotransferase
LNWDQDRTGAEAPKLQPDNGLGKARSNLAALALLVLAAGCVTAHADGRRAEFIGAPTVEPATCTTSNIRILSLDRASADRVIAKPPDYTQGLLLVDGSLYESTGKVGQSAIYRLDLAGGPRTKLLALDERFFGEGLAKVGDRFYQLTWKDGLAFAYDFDGERLSLTRTFRRDGHGWGLTDLDGELVLSDGTDRLSFIDPANFTTRRVVRVQLGDRALARLNELESVGHVILANIYGDNSIVSIQPSSGCVDAVIDASALVADVAYEIGALPQPVCIGPCSPWDFVLNGIAYDASKNELYITGKNWPAIFVYRDLLR